MKKLTILIAILITTMSFAQVPSYVPANGLVGWWPFNGNANDESGNGNNGTVNGATLTIDRNGNVNSAYSFDGVDDYIQTNFHGIQGGASRSVSFWAKTSGNNVNLNQDNMNVLCYGGPSNGGNFEVALNHVCEGLTLDINNGVNTKSSVVNNDTWNYFTLVFNSLSGGDFNSVSYYTNSVLLGTTCQIGTLTAINTVNNYPIVLGAYWDHISRVFQGKLDDIGIWNRALTNCEIQNLYTSTNPTSTTTASACNNYTWNGTTYTQSGVYTGTTANCVTESLNLTITPSSINTTTASACDSYLWNGTTYNSSGVYSGQTANCVTESLDLTINSSTSSTQTQIALDTYTWPLNNQTYTQGGTYTATIPNAAGCDSVVTLNLTLNYTGINEPIGSAVSISPNPTTSKITVKSTLALIGEEFTIYDQQGKVVKSGVITAEETEIDLSNLSEGVYLFKAGAEMQETFKIIKQ